MVPLLQNTVKYFKKTRVLSFLYKVGSCGVVGVRLSRCFLWRGEQKSLSHVYRVRCIAGSAVYANECVVDVICEGMAVCTLLLCAILCFSANASAAEPIVILALRFLFFYTELLSSQQKGAFIASLMCRRASFWV